MDDHKLVLYPKLLWHYSMHGLKIQGIDPPDPLNSSNIWLTLWLWSIYNICINFDKDFPKFRPLNFQHNHKFLAIHRILTQLEGISLKEYKVHVL
jgi:hypothetical protein